MLDQIRGRAVSDGLKSIGNDDAADFGVFYRVCRLCRSNNRKGRLKLFFRRPFITSNRYSGHFSAGLFSITALNWF